MYIPSAAHRLQNSLRADMSDRVRERRVIPPNPVFPYFENAFIFSPKRSLLHLYNSSHQPLGRLPPLVLSFISNDYSY